MKLASLWHIRDLVVDHKTGKLRETALWSNIGKTAMTWAFCWLTLKNQLTEWYVLAYGGIVVFHELGSRVISRGVLDRAPPHDGQP
jgi:hypothetical protein